MYSIDFGLQSEDGNHISVCIWHYTKCSVSLILSESIKCCYAKQQYSKWLKKYKKKKSANEAEPVLLAKLLHAISIHFEWVPFSFPE